MESIVLVTGNRHKAKLFEQNLTVSIEQLALDVDEIQSLDLREVLEAKARSAYEKIQKPLIVNDTSVAFTDLHGLPGPLIRWFQESLGNEGLCRLASLGDTRKAIVETGIGYCDGDTFEAFIARTKGTIAPKPKGENGWDWDAVFIPEGYTITRGEMTNLQYEESSLYKQAFEAFGAFLETKQ